MKVDAHQHFWHYDPVEYDWIDESMRAIRRDFLPRDLSDVLRNSGIDGAVAVQARQTLEETHWLLQLAAQNPDLIKGVVGWVPLLEQGSRVGLLLDQLCHDSKFKGVRHVLQGEPDHYMAEPSFNEAIRELGPRNLTYDLLIFAHQLTAAIAFVDRHPDLPIVLDHIAKPVVTPTPSDDWVKGLRELARRENVCCKFSGVVTEIPRGQWTPELLRPYFDIVLQTFGPDRVMFGSDWPVCQVGIQHAEWVHFVESCVADLSAQERSAVWGENAIRFYRL